ncbi:MAG: NAD-dependent succinate-semialdehyde dehydrogenase, partial [Hyphomicrobiales bacterium]
MYDNLLANVPTDLWIGGKWKKASDGGRFDVIDPATEKTIASVASATVEDAKAAIDAADAAFPAWAAKKPRERGEILRKAFDIIIRDAERYAKIITLENGKSLSDSRGEVAYAAEFFRWYAEEAVRNVGQVSIAPASGARIVAQQKPAGIAVLVTPWNFPAAMATRKIGPALAAGCPVVLKPASDTPLTMLALMQALEEAGVPPGVVNVIPSRSSGKVVSAMLHDMRVRVVSFTGSTEVGRKLLHEAADNIVKPAMELGGNAPFIVFEDADIDAAIDGAMIAKMRNMGEACTAANRFYVHEKVHDEFAKKLTDKMAALKVGNGLDDGVAVGPLVNAEGRDKVIELVDDAVAKGAKVLTGGKAPGGVGFFYPATVITNVPDSAKMLREEIFGPVASIQTFKAEDEVIKRANDTEYGLVAYLYTKDMSRGLRVSEKLDFGMIGLNRGLVSDPAAPFGGT